LEGCLIPLSKSVDALSEAMTNPSSQEIAIMRVIIFFIDV